MRNKKQQSNKDKFKRLILQLPVENEKFKYDWHKQVLKLPLFGEMILKSMLARVSLILGNLRKSPGHF